MQNYEMLGAIGQGQFGVVYKAKHKLDGSIVCIKRVPMSAKEDQTSTLREASLLSTLDHPNIIKYKECLLDDEGALMIVTSFCEEGDLFKRIRTRRDRNELFSEQEIMDMFIQISSALMYIHGKKVLHRDLKTQNIFIARGSIMVLGDFGISKVLEKTDQFATTVTGTPYYMAPEICSSQPYTLKSDIWSLGCVLYELCTLKHAFAADSLLSLVYQIVRGNFPPIPTDKFSAGLSDLVNRLLVREPNQRPTLTQVFQLPYVQQHLQRYKEEENRRLVRTSTTMRKKQLLEQTPLIQMDPAEMQALTPKEQMAKRREMQRQKEELALKLATMNAGQNQRQAQERKNRMIHESNVGALVGHRPTSRVSSRDDDVADVTRQRAVSAMDESMVNYGTLPSSSQYMPEQQIGTVGRGAAGYGDTVLMGSVMVGGMTQGTATRGGTRGGGAGAVGATGRFEGTDMVNMGSVNFGGTGTAGGRAPAAFAPPTVDHGFKFGVPKAVAVPGGGARRDGQLASTQSLPQSPATPHVGGGARGETHSRHKSQSLGPPVQQYEDDSASEYENDFEEYDGEEGREQMAKTRMKLLNNVKELERTVLSAATANAQQDHAGMMEETVKSTVKNSKAQALRERCSQLLGPRFNDVYSYLRKVRTSSGPPPSEAEVQRRLMELVGNRKELLQGCFNVDQLVFTESMR